MLKGYVRNPSDALIYMISCTLATVSDLAMKKNKPKHEYERQISIAQTGLDWLKEFHIQTEDTRIIDILTNHNGSVKEWAKRFEPKEPK